MLEENPTNSSRVFSDEARSGEGGGPFAGAQFEEQGPRRKTSGVEQQPSQAFEERVFATREGERCIREKAFLPVGWGGEGSAPKEFAAQARGRGPSLRLQTRPSSKESSLLLLSSSLLESKKTDPAEAEDAPGSAQTPMEISHRRLRSSPLALRAVASRLLDFTSSRKRTSAAGMRRAVP